MARFSLGGGGDEGEEQEEERPSYNNRKNFDEEEDDDDDFIIGSSSSIDRRRLWKKPRISPDSSSSSGQQPSSSKNTHPISESCDSQSQQQGQDEDDQESDDEDEDKLMSGPISMTLTDPDVFDCPICFNPLSSPVFQCENGHTACASCCTIMRNKCPNCCMPIGYNRCRAMEKVLESVRLSCRNKQYGCNETLSYGELSAHEKTCNDAPCYCPHPSCDYIGNSECLYTHFATAHSASSTQFEFGSSFTICLENSQKHVFLQEKNERILFVINNSPLESVGSLVNVVCVAPASGKRRFVYSLSARDGIESSIKLKSRTECVPKWTSRSPTAKKSLIVPSDFIRVPSGQLKLNLTIWGDR